LDFFMAASRNLVVRRQERFAGVDDFLRSIGISALRISEDIARGL
jgi:hypothetical protein